MQHRNNIFAKFFVAVVIMFTALTACTNNDDITPTVDIKEDTYTVALIFPMDTVGNFVVHSTLSMFEKNLEQAQQGCAHRIKLNVEEYDENSVNMSQLATELANRDDVKAIIGPYNQNNLKTISNKLKLSETKALMAINASSTDIVRGSVERGNYFWTLTQTDISKCEIILSTAAQMGARNFDLICSDEGYVSQTYKDWLPFEATELGLNIEGNYLYGDTARIRGMIDRCFEGDNLDEKAIICVPENEQELYIMVKELNKKLNAITDDKRPKIFMSDNVSLMYRASDILSDLIFYAVANTCSPSSGFYQGYKSYTDENPFSVQAQIYDALMLSAMALANNPDDINNSLIDITGKDTSESIVGWTPENMTSVFKDIEKGAFTKHVTGASSSLVFDEDNHTCVTSSYYMLYFCHYGYMQALAYYSADKSNHTASAVADWKWQSEQLQDFTNVTYKPSNNIPLDKRWAVVVAASEGFENYRHQADALSVYQYLKYIGYDDDHILLIMADDIANNPSNKEPGKVLAIDGSNIYNDVHVDYKLSELTAQQVMDKIAELPCGANDNVMVFWSGHGEPGYLKYGNSSITPKMVTDAQDKLNGRYRKMAWLIEACYSGCIGQALQDKGYDHLLAMTAANANETSKAYLYNDELCVWQSNRFTAYLLTQVKEQPTSSIRSLYQYIFMQTIGSHASIYNYANYGDITEELVNEYF